MKFTAREYILAWITAVVVLFGLTTVLAMPRIREIGRMREERAKLQRKLTVAERTVAQKSDWDKRLQALQSKLNRYPQGKDVTADMLIALERIAEKHPLKMISRDVEKESKHGGLYELAINCKWEGNLQGIVAFLFDLQSEGVMMDTSQISIAPNERRVLRGSMIVNAAYCRSASTGAVVTDQKSGSEAEGKK